MRTERPATKRRPVEQTYGSSEYLLQSREDSRSLAYTCTFTAMGKRRPIPNDLWVTFNTGAACWRLYSDRSTRDTIFSTSSSGKLFFCAMHSGVSYRSTYASRMGSRVSYGGSESVSLWPGRSSAEGGLSRIGWGITSRS